MAFVLSAVAWMPAAAEVVVVGTESDGDKVGVAAAQARYERDLEGLRESGHTVEEIQTERGPITLVVTPAVFEPIDRRAGLTEACLARGSFRPSDLEDPAVADEVRRRFVNYHPDPWVVPSIGLVAYLWIEGQYTAMTHEGGFDWDSVESQEQDVPKLEDHPPFPSDHLVFNFSRTATTRGDHYALSAIASDHLAKLIEQRREAAATERRRLLTQLMERTDGSFGRVPLEGLKSMDALPEEIRNQWQEEFVSNWEPRGFSSELAALEAWNQAEVREIRTHLVLRAVFTGPAFGMVRVSSHIP